MKNIEEYIIEKEFDDYFLIEEGFFSWIIKLGKKFWAWLTNKDYTGKNVDWDVGETKKVQWVGTKSSEFKKITNNEGLAENFPSTMRIIKTVPNVMMMQAMNSGKTPIVMILVTTDKKTIKKILQKNTKDYDRYENRVERVKRPVMLLSIEIAKNNNDSDKYLFYGHIVKEIDKNLINKYDAVFIDKKRVRYTFQTFLQNEYNCDKDFPVLTAEMLQDNENDRSSSRKHDMYEQKSAKKNIPYNYNIIEFSNTLNNKVIETAEYTNESLDVDNLFWMLDTWFANNEQEKTTFMSLIDNCIIKKTYNKNDLAKLCDNINFDIRPFINFMCKDAVLNANEIEDANIDYYYELKKIIDALISNKATNNKYVRFS